MASIVNDNENEKDPNYIPPDDNDIETRINNANEYIDTIDQYLEYNNSYKMKITYTYDEKTKEYLYLLKDNNKQIGRVALDSEYENDTFMYHNTRSVANGTTRYPPLLYGVHVKCLEIHKEYENKGFGKMLFQYALSHIYIIKLYDFIELDDASDHQIYTSMGFFPKEYLIEDNPRYNSTKPVNKKNKRILLVFLDGTSYNTVYHFFRVIIPESTDNFMDKIKNPNRNRSRNSRRKHSRRNRSHNRNRSPHRNGGGRNKKTIRNQKKSSQGTLKNRNRAK
jgi:GNAT superfamily N-acetyltransferase